MYRREFVAVGGVCEEEGASRGERCTAVCRGEGRGPAQSLAPVLAAVATTQTRTVTWRRGETRHVSPFRPAQLFPTPHPTKRKGDARKRRYHFGES